LSQVGELIAIQYVVTSGGHDTLGELCTCYGVERSRRTQHGALLAPELLAAVYVELTTTPQAALQLEPLAVLPSNIQGISRARPRPLPPRVTTDDRDAHWVLVRTLGSEAIWGEFYTEQCAAPATPPYASGSMP
jgi:DNA polymerase-3 subunit epsilon